MFTDDLTKDSLLQAASKSLEYLRKIAAEEPSRHALGSAWHSAPTGAGRHALDRKISMKDLVASMKEFIRIAENSKTNKELNVRLRDGFDLYQSVGSDDAGKVIFSSYYVPTCPASLKPTDKFKYPLYSWPHDLIVVDLGVFDRKLKGQTILGRATSDKTLIPYYTRHDIDTGKVLAGKHLEVAWMADQFDRLNVHLEGSGILQLEDGRRLLARHTMTNGLKYQSVGLALVNAGIIPKVEISYAYERLRKYLKENPEKEGWAAELNPRYVFFELVPLPSDGETFGRIHGSWITSLTAGRSIAVDPNVFPLGSIAYYETPMPEMGQDGHVAKITTTTRFAFPQDTGGAILGPGRVDIYAGAGTQAEFAATHQWSKGKIYILLNKK